MSGGRACRSTAGRFHHMPLPSVSAWRGHYLYGLLGTPLIDPERPAEALDALLRALLAHPGIWFAGIDTVSLDGPLAPALEQVLGALRPRPTVPRALRAGSPAAAPGGDLPRGVAEREEAQGAATAAAATWRGAGGRARDRRAGRRGRRLRRVHRARGGRGDERSRRRSGGRSRARAVLSRDVPRVRRARPAAGPVAAGRGTDRRRPR